MPLFDYAHYAVIDHYLAIWLTALIVLLISEREVFA